MALFPAMLAALFGAANWSLAQLPGTRRAALRDSLEGAPRLALERYIEHRSVIEARWLVVRAIGVALTAVLLAEVLPKEILGPWVPPAAALGAVVAYAVPAEMLKAAAQQAPERWAPWFLRLLRPVELLVAPLAAAPLWLSSLVTKRLERNRTEPPPAVTENEVGLMVTEGENSGALDHEQSEIIRNVLEFGDVTARDVMVPRTQTISFEISVPVTEILRHVAEAAHSRYPVHRETVDNVVGVLHAKDLLHAVARGDSATLHLESILRPVVFVPESQSAASVLKDMRAGRHHLAIVLDEFGGFSGIVTLEDLLEQIVGDIRDEHDVEEAPIADLGEGKLIVDASLPLADLSRYLGTELPADGDYHSLGGFLAAHHGRVPEVGATLSKFGLEFIVREADERRVTKVEIHRDAPPMSIAPRTPGRVSAA
ncbi:MAG TPA: hemolysin family protein [Polyangiaceae bacterium]|nr:hemolysin family protein [Polyangiaceae bacterium]